MALTKVIGAGLGAVTESSSLSYGNSQASIVVQDDTNPNIVINDTGQSKDYFITALGSQLSIRYADGGGSGSASNVTQLMSMDNSGDISKPTSEFAGFIKTDISEEQDGSQYRYGLRYTEFVAPLIQAVKDQQATIDVLTARITALENGE